MGTASQNWGQKFYAFYLKRILDTLAFDVSYKIKTSSTLSSLEDLKSVEDVDFVSTFLDNLFLLREATGDKLDITTSNAFLINIAGNDPDLYLKMLGQDKEYAELVESEYGDLFFKAEVTEKDEFALWGNLGDDLDYTSAVAGVSEDWGKMTQTLVGAMGCVPEFQQENKTISSGGDAEMLSEYLEEENKDSTTAIGVSSAEQLMLGNPLFESLGITVSTAEEEVDEEVEDFSVSADDETPIAVDHSLVDFEPLELVSVEDEDEDFSVSLSDTWESDYLDPEFSTFGADSAEDGYADEGESGEEGYEFEGEDIFEDDFEGEDEEDLEDDEELEDEDEFEFEGEDVFEDDDFEEDDFEEDDLEDDQSEDEESDDDSDFEFEGEDVFEDGDFEEDSDTEDFDGPPVENSRSIEHTSNTFGGFPNDRQGTGKTVGDTSPSFANPWANNSSFVDSVGQPYSPSGIPYIDSNATKPTKPKYRDSVPEVKNSKDQLALNILKTADRIVGTPKSVTAGVSKVLKGVVKPKFKK